VSWRAFVAPIAAALGRDVDHLPTPSSSAILKRRPPASTWLGPPLRSAYRMLPRQLAAPARIAVRLARESRPHATAPPAEAFSRELALLHSCQVRLPHTKAESRLGYRPVVTFDEACRRSVAWLGFAGYPVQ